MQGLVQRDEREAGIDRAADRLAYLVLSYGLLAVVAFRAFKAHESSWDLLGLIVLGGFVGVAYRARYRSLSGQWALVLGITVAVALAVAVLLVLALPR